MTKKKQSAGDKKRYELYKNEGRAAKNKARKLEKHLRAHPGDAQSKARATPPWKEIEARKRSEELRKAQSRGRGR